MKTNTLFLALVLTVIVVGCFIAAGGLDWLLS
jgi:hypothetical protein